MPFPLDQSAAVSLQEWKMSGGMNSVDAVKKKIKVLQDQAEEAEERAEQLQREVEKEKRTREEVRALVLIRF